MSKRTQPACEPLEARRLLSSVVMNVISANSIGMFTYGGDANLDGRIDINDYNRIDPNSSRSGTASNWYNGDFNYDGEINIDDYGIIGGRGGVTDLIDSRDRWLTPGLTDRVVIDSFDPVIAGTAGDDQISVGYLEDVFSLSPTGPNYFFVDVNKERFTLTQARSLRIDARRGNDSIIFVGDATRTLPVTILGGAGDDTIVGGPGAERIFAGTGNDQVSGCDGRDTIYGEEGDDSVRGGGGSDLLDGGDGADTLRGDAGNDNLSGGANSDRLRGSAGNDRLEGGGGRDHLAGEADDDLLVGGSGNDVLAGGVGNDYLEGNIGFDWLFGDAGEDVLRGGADLDRLWGGDQSDSFEHGEWVISDDYGLSEVQDYLAGEDRLPAA